MSDHTLILGSAPRPSEGRAFADALREALQRELSQECTGLESVGVTSALDGADIACLDLNLTGLHATNNRLPQLKLPKPTTESTEAGRLRHVTVEAHPLVVQQASIDVTASVDNVPFEWVVTVDGQYGLRLAEANDADDPVTGGGQASISKADLESLVAAFADAAAADMGFHVSDVHVDVQQLNARELAVTADARIKKGFIAAPARVTARASLDESMAVVVSELTARSSNPVVNGLIGLMRGQLEQFNGKRIEINESLPAGIKLTSAEFQVSDRITVSGTIG